MRRLALSVSILTLAGCLPMQMRPDDQPTQQVGVALQPPQRSLPTRASYPSAPIDVSHRVLLIKDRLVGQNPQIGIKPYIQAIGSADPEVFHVGLDQVFITEGLVRQCRSDGELAGIIANELGKMIAEREAGVSDEVRRPDRLPPPRLPIGGGFDPNEVDPHHRIEMARHEKQFPRQAGKVARPNPQNVARDILDRAGFQRTDLDAAWPILQNAQRYFALENQFKGNIRQGDWRTP